MGQLRLCLKLSFIYFTLCYLRQNKNYASRAFPHKIAVKKLLLMANHVKKWANTVHKRLITHEERFILISISFTKRNNPHHTPSHDMSNICRNNKWIRFIVHYTETGLPCCLFVFWHFFLTTFHFWDRIRVCYPEQEYMIIFILDCINILWLVNALLLSELQYIIEISNTDRCIFACTGPS